MKNRYAFIVALLILLTVICGCSQEMAQEKTAAESSSLEKEPEDNGKKGLPQYAYTGKNPYIKAICQYFCKKEELEQEQYPDRKDSIYIPVPVIMKVQKEGEEVFVYGTFWDMWYTLEEHNLYCQSGGENTGRLKLVKQDETFVVTEFEKIRNGGDYPEDWKKLCGEDQELYERLFTKEEREDRREQIRGEQIRQYAIENELSIETYQDYGWEAKKLPGISGVTMEVEEESVTPTSLTLRFVNTTDLDIQYGDPYRLEKWENGMWQPVPYQLDSFGFHSVAYCPKKGQPQTMDVDWKLLYGELEEGMYRIVKEIQDYRAPGDYDLYEMYAEFNL